MGYTPDGFEFEVWKGPEESGVSQSLIQRFLECPYSFYLYAYLGKEDPSPLEPNLIWGDLFHKGLEYLLFGIEDVSLAQIEVENYAKRYPKLGRTFIPSVCAMLSLYKKKLYLHPFETEVVFDYLVGGVRHRGKFDGICKGTQLELIEHKCKGNIYPIQTIHELPSDLQLNFYAWNLFKTTTYDSIKIYYDLIKIPDTQWNFPELKVGDPKAHVNNVYFSNNYFRGEGFPISKYSSMWLQQLEITFNRGQVELYYNYVIRPIIERMRRYHDHVTQPNFNPEDPRFYNYLFYRVPLRFFNSRITEKYKPRYWKYLSGQQDFEELVPVKSIFNELTNEDD